MNAVRSGQVAADLLKPLPYFTFWLAPDVGRAAAGLLLRGVPSSPPMPSPSGTSPTRWACRLRDLALREPDTESTIRRIYEERLLEAVVPVLPTASPNSCST